MYTDGLILINNEFFLNVFGATMQAPSDKSDVVIG